MSVFACCIQNRLNLLSPLRACASSLSREKMERRNMKWTHGIPNRYSLAFTPSFRMTVIRPVGTSSRGSIGRSRCDSFRSRTFCRVIARIGTVHFAGGNFGGISAYPGAASLRFTFTCALASPMDQRIPPASRFRKNSFFQFSGRSPIAV